MTMLKKLAMLLCASFFILSQSVIAAGNEGEAVEKAAETAKEIATEATAAGVPADEEKMKEGAMQDGDMKEGEKKVETPEK
jgi:hypothetical protein